MEARRALLDDALHGLELVRSLEGEIIDVGSGGGTPGIPLAASLPERDVTLLESQRRKCEFLEAWQEELSNLHVVWGRAEEQPTDHFGLALAKALAPPVVATELCAPLVRLGGAILLWVGPNAEPDKVAVAAGRLGARLESAPAGFLLLRKVGPTPSGFPRRAGMAAKRPLA